MMSEIKHLSSSIILVRESDGSVWLLTKDQATDQVTRTKMFDPIISYEGEDDDTNTDNQEN